MRLLLQRKLRRIVSEQVAGARSGPFGPSERVDDLGFIGGRLRPLLSSRCCSRSASR
jgi:hypothetical protein